MRLELDDKIKRCRSSLALIDRKHGELSDTSFDWKQLAARTQRIQALVQERDPTALKRAYQHLFKAIVIGEPDANAMRPIRHILRNENDDGQWQPQQNGIGSGEGAVNVTGDYSDEERMARRF